MMGKPSGARGRGGQKEAHTTCPVKTDEEVLIEREACSACCVSELSPREVASLVDGARTTRECSVPTPGANITRRR